MVLKPFAIKTSDLMARGITSNSYEEARNQQLLANKKRFEDLGILKISKTLSDISNSQKKSKQRKVKLKIRNAQIIEPRRSTRAHKPILAYQDEVGRGRSKSCSSWASYLARSLEEVKMASYETRVQAIKSAEQLQSNLQSEYPSFVKSVFRSHLYKCYWLDLPKSFCRKHFLKAKVNIMLEDEEGNEYNSVFSRCKIGPSGGWRAFALKHKLEDGDALVFEIVERTRFKIYVVKASDCGSQVDDDDNVDEEAAETKKTLEDGKKPAAKNSDLNQEDDDDMSNVDNEAEETKKTPMPTKKLKKEINSPAENGKKPISNSGQTKKPNMSEESCDRNSAFCQEPKLRNEFGKV